MILKLVTRQDWAAALSDGVYRGSPADLRDGFIHFSAPHQVRETAARHFRGASDIVLVAFDEAALGDGLRWEPSRGGDLFPHLYGPLPTSLALSTRLLALADDGVPAIPADLEPC